MSHITRVQCEVADEELIVRAAERLGLVVERNATPRYWGTNYGGLEGEPCELVLRLPGKYDLGVKRQEDGTYQWVCDTELLSGRFGEDDPGRKLLGENAVNLMTAYGCAAVERDILSGASYQTSVGADGTQYYDVEEEELKRIGY
jgi:hypothetical protein